MKQIENKFKPGDQRSFPPIDYHYQSTLESAAATVQETPEVYRSRGLWKLSTGYFGVEASLAFATELLFFGVIAALSAWPVITALVAVTRMVRNY